MIFIGIILTFLVLELGFFIYGMLTLVSKLDDTIKEVDKHITEQLTVLAKKEPNIMPF